jgi:hypothetical protein
MCKQAKLQNSMQKYKFYEITKKKTFCKNDLPLVKRDKNSQDNYKNGHYDLWGLVRAVGAGEKD